MNEGSDWAALHTIALSLLDSDDPKVAVDLVNFTKTAIEEDGFLSLAKYSVSLEQLQSPILSRTVPARGHIR